MLFPTDDHFNLALSRLPVSPHVLSEVIGLCNEAETVTEDIVTVIRKDAVLTSRFIELTGYSSGFSFTNGIESDRPGIPDLIPAIRSLASTAAINQFFSPLDADSMQLWSRLWMHSLTCAHLCRKLAQRIGLRDIDGAFVTGLLHQIGRMAFFARDPEGYALMLNGASDMAALLDREEDRYGIDSAQTGAGIIERWGLKSFMADAVRYQAAAVSLMHDAADLVRLLNLTARLCEHRFPGAAETAVIEDPYFGLETSELEQLLVDASNSAIAEAREIGIEVEESSLGPVAVLDNPEIRIMLGQIVRDAALQDSLENRYRAAGDSAGIRQGIGENLQILLGLSSAILFIPDFDDECLRPCAEDIRRQSALGHLSIALQPQRSLISEALLRKRSLISTQQDRFRELPVIDRQVLDLLGGEALLCLPLNHQNRLYGALAVGCSKDRAEALHANAEQLELLARVTASAIANQALNEITHRSQLEHQALENQIRVRKIAHEINNPLTIINNYLEVLGPELKKSSANHDKLDIMRAEVERVAEILQRFRMETSAAPDDTQLVQINDLIEKLFEFFQPTFYKQNRIKGVLELDPSVPALATDALKLKQVLTNLLKNAVEAMTDKGQIKIKTRGLVFVNSRQYTEISVSDNGDGLPQSVIQHLYRPLESSKGAEHSGLGLAIVYRLVSELKGIIHYATSDSGGAEFRILLPRAEG